MFLFLSMSEYSSVVMSPPQSFENPENWSAGSLVLLTAFFMELTSRLMRSSLSSFGSVASISIYASFMLNVPIILYFLVAVSALVRAFSISIVLIVVSVLNLRFPLVPFSFICGLKCSLWLVVYIFHGALTGVCTLVRGSKSVAKLMSFVECSKQINTKRSFVRVI